MRPTFDDKDLEILNTRLAARYALNNEVGPLVGDIVYMPDGTQARFSYDWGDRIQTSDGKSGATFYLGWGGHAVMSGGLQPAIDKSKIVETGEMEDARFWLFHHDWHIAHNGVDVEIRVPVFQYKP